jgi:hypothetical protein
MDTCVETALQLGLGIPPKSLTAKEIQQSSLKMETRLYATACDKLVKTGLFLQSSDSSRTISET